MRAEPDIKDQLIEPVFLCKSTAFGSRLAPSFKVRFSSDWCELLSAISLAPQQKGAEDENRHFRRTLNPVE